MTYIANDLEYKQRLYLRVEVWSPNWVDQIADVNQEMSPRET